MAVETLIMGNDLTVKMLIAGCTVTVQMPIPRPSN
jgi:hypothetical protein